jgi:hypothetical protein
MVVTVSGIFEANLSRMKNNVRPRRLVCDHEKNMLVLRSLVIIIASKKWSSSRRREGRKAANEANALR